MRWVERQARRFGFEVLLGTVLGLYVVSIWQVFMPPLQDYGGHIEFMDIVARYADPATNYASIFQLPDRPLPNTLSLGVAWALRGVFDANIVGKLLLTFYVVGLPLAFLALCRVTGRPRWWVFLAAPLTVSTMLTLGLLNYLVALPLLVASLVFAIRWARDGSRQAAVFLALCVIGLGFAHMIAYLFAGFFITVVLLLYTRRPRDLLRFGIFLPSLAPIVGFATLHFSGDRPAGPEQSGLEWRGLARTISDVWNYAVDLFATPLDDIVGLVLGVGLLVMLLQGHLRAAPVNPPQHKGLLERLRERPMEVLAVSCLLLYLAMPFSYGQVYVQFRLPVLLVPLVLMVPAYRQTRLTHAVVALAVVASLTSASLTVMQFGRVAAPHGNLPNALTQVPERARLLAPYPAPDRRRLMKSMPEQHNVRGLHTLLNGGMAIPSFTTNWFSPVRLRAGLNPPPATVGLGSAHAKDFDYAMLMSRGRGRAIASTHDHLRLMWEDAHWSLFKIVDPRPPRMTVMTSSPLGAPIAHPCPEASAMSGLRVTFDPLGLRTLAARCVRLSHQRAVVGESKEGRLFGRREKKAGTLYRYPSITIDCPRGKVVTGLVGTEGVQLRSLGVACSLPRFALDEAVSPRPPVLRMANPLAANGDKAPSPRPPAPFFDLRCPSGTVAVGFRGRAGTRMEAVGLACDALTVAEPEPVTPR